MIDYPGARQRMAERLAARGIADARVLAAMAKVPRHRFVAEAFRHRAYDDHSLPIGEQQTISQPFTVAQMTQALRLTGRERVLEVGTGSGYQTAVLAELAEKVYSVERLPALAARARRLLDELGYHTVVIWQRDGSYGWPEEAPFDAIIVTAAAAAVPPALVEQLAPGGRLVIPIGPPAGPQRLVRLVKGGAGEPPVEEWLAPCRFVELVGDAIPLASEEARTWST
ncbi:MAG TPA: protein-L-isoaspartate(D-aspartate) O-methyltransferase [Thermodesulfobacteriota bacterium]|nr:protein-L-isoaspartate(D-aspartate) O-methyltransferase [Thermodesulfobacteriota bacterium]